MFVGFISAKEFFSIINRKIIENHKLNLFDVNIDPVEFKMWFGDNPNSEKQKDLEVYFAYCVAANLNGYQFYSPANLSNGITLLAALYFSEAMEEFPDYYFVQLLYTVFLLSFTFVARIKVFPYQQQQENYNRFVEVFFDFYRITFLHLDTKISKEDFESVKKALLRQTSFFFLLFHYYKKLNTLLVDKSTDEDFLDRILGKTNNDKLLQAFKQNYATTKYLPHSSPLEQSVINLVRPADILIKYLIGDSSPFLVVDTIISRIFSKTELDPLVQSFLKSDEKLPILFDYLLEYKKYKYWFFAGIQNYIIKLFRAEGKEELLEDIDEMLSAIDNGDDFSSFDVPERIKRESRVTERLLNFYVTLLGGFTTARWDSFFLRRNKPELLNYLTKDTLNTMLWSQVQLEYAGNMLFQYAKNLYYYHFIDGRVRAGKNKFSIPVKWEPLDMTSNFTVLKLYTEGMIANFFQDINPKDTKLTIKNTQFLTDFRERFWAKISQRVKKSNSDFLSELYAPLFAQLQNHEELYVLLREQFTDEDISNLKDALYKLDFWAHHMWMQRFEKVKLEKQYGCSGLIAIFGAMRETFFWFLLLMTSMQENQDMKIDQEQLDGLWIFYFQEIIGVKIPRASLLLGQLKEVYQELYPFFKVWIAFDDNPDFFKLVTKSIVKFVAKKTATELLKSFSGEDMVWFRGVLKNISYYNQRYVIPK